MELAASGLAELLLDCARMTTVEEQFLLRTRVVIGTAKRLGGDERQQFERTWQTKIRVTLSR
jgi:hypothetical protein